MQTLTIQGFVVSARWISSAKCWRISIDVLENQKPIYDRIPGLIETHRSITFSPANDSSLTGHQPGKAPVKQPDGTSIKMITDGQRKMLWVMFEKQGIQERYGVTTKEDAEKEFKRRMGVEHLRDVPAEAVAQTLDKMVAFLDETEKEGKGEPEKQPGS